MMLFFVMFQTELFVKKYHCLTFMVHHACGLQFTIKLSKRLITKQFCKDESGFFLPPIIHKSQMEPKQSELFRTKRDVKVCCVDKECDTLVCHTHLSHCFQNKTKITFILTKYNVLCFTIDLPSNKSSRLILWLSHCTLLSHKAAYLFTR